jgi:hypothetical protein
MISSLGSENAVSKISLLWQYTIKLLKIPAFSR